MRSTPHAKAILVRYHLDTSAGSPRCKKGPLITAIVISECVNFLFVAHDKHDRYEKGYIQQQYHWLLW